MTIREFIDKRMQEEPKIADAIRVTLYNKQKKGINNSIIELLTQAQLKDFISVRYGLSDTQIQAIFNFIDKLNDDCVQSYIHQKGENVGFENIINEMVIQARGKAEFESRKRGETSLNDTDIEDQINNLEISDVINKLNEKEKSLREEQE